MDQKEELGGLYIPSLEEGIPDKVTKKELKEALDAYASADKEWRDNVSRKYLAEKENAGDNLYRLGMALLRNNGFYSYRDAVIDSLSEDRPSPKAEDFE